MSKLLVGAALSNLDEAETQEDRNDLMRFEDGNGHDSAHFDGLNPDKLGVKDGLAVFQ
jgi:hypothetical protein